MSMKTPAKTPAKTPRKKARRKISKMANLADLDEDGDVTEGAVGGEISDPLSSDLLKDKGGPTIPAEGVTTSTTAPVTPAPAANNETDLSASGNFDPSVLEEAAAEAGPAAGGGGMNVFGIGKDGISRAIMKFLTPPSPSPLTVCFQFSGVFLTHRYVVAMMKSLLMGIENAGSVKNVQFMDRNVVLGTRNLENRWLVTVTNQVAKDLLMEQGISIVNRKIPIRSYDEVMKEEYLEFQEYLDHQRRMGMKNNMDTRDNVVDADSEAAGEGDTARTVTAPLPPAVPVYNSDDSDREP